MNRIANSKMLIPSIICNSEVNLSNDFCEDWIRILGLDSSEYIPHDLRKDLVDISPIHPLLKDVHFTEVIAALERAD